MSMMRKWVLVMFVVGIGLGFSLSGASMPTLAASVQGTMPLVAGACPEPPANVDLTRASDQEIAFYGLPRRPKDAQGLVQWTTIIHHAKHRTCTSVSTHEYSQSPLHSASIDARQVSPNTYTNTIWAGYVDGSGSGNGFNAVKANWNVPCDGSHTPYGSHAITWVGIGGQFGNNLWQGGTIEDPTWGLNFWWEAFPNNDIQFVNGIPLYCTNHIFAQADYNYTHSGENYIFLQNISTNEYFSTTYGYYSFVPNIQSTEWIDERPTCPSKMPSELADFNYIQWSNGLAHPTGANYWGGISSFSPRAFKMIDVNGLILAQPQNLNSDGKSFTDHWYANGFGDLC